MNQFGRQNGEGLNRSQNDVDVLCEGRLRVVFHRHLMMITSVAAVGRLGLERKLVEGWRTGGWEGEWSKEQIRKVDF